MMRWLTRILRRPTPYQVVRAEYEAAHRAFLEAKGRKDTRDMNRWLGVQSRLLPDLLRMELRL